MALRLSEGLGRAGEIERSCEGKAFLRSATVFAGWKNAWFEAFTAVCKQSHAPKTAPLEVAEAAQMKWDLPATGKVLFSRFVETKKQIRRW